MLSPIEFYAGTWPPQFVPKLIFSILFFFPALWHRKYSKAWETGIIFHTWGIRLLGFGGQIVMHYQNPFQSKQKPEKGGE